MILRSFIKARAAELESISDSAELDVTLLLQHVLQCDRAYIFREPNHELSPEIIAAFEPLFQRRLRGEPIAYILGQQAFWDFDLKVTPDTLIPRPETECLIEALLARLENRSDFSVVDLGTGTGAIALTLQKERPDWHVLAIDRSEAALAVAKANAAALQLTKIRFLASDWFTALTDMQFDLIVSNPPYIDPEDPALKRLQHEPLTALAADEQGYADLKTLITEAPTYLKRGGLLALEHGADQQNLLAEILTKNGFEITQLGRDYAGLDRFLIAKYT